MFKCIIYYSLVSIYFELMPQMITSQLIAFQLNLIQDGESKQKIEQRMKLFPCQFITSGRHLCFTYTSFV